MSCVCQNCKRKFKVDFNLPDYLWKRITGKKLLCGSCIVEKLESLGYGAYFLQDLIISPKTEIEALRAQLAEKDKKIERLKEKTWCAYCGFEIDLDDSAASKISEHIKMCSKHPIRAYERHCEELEKENAELRERLKASEKGVIK